VLAVDAGSEVERCYRAERKTAAAEFWQRIAPKFEERYGKEGALWARIRMGYIKWISNELPDAVKSYESILAEAQPQADFKAIAAKAIYILGKIADDRGEFDAASKYYADYLEKFSDQEDFEFALNSLVINLAAKKQWSKMVVPLDHFLMQQSLTHIDKRPVGAMAFSLFWMGRAHLQMGNKELAREMWRRLAAEYYSTFYGAMGHYLLEQSSGRSYAIEPSRVSGFDFNEFESALPVASKAASKRTQAFLAAGMPERARCEVEEVIAGGATDYDGLLARTLLLHASGAWLDAIKIYDAIPRSVRNGLPVGFERVLFPRKYADVVKAKAAKLDLDPDFVFALMRQESVFSKDAMSPVGAVGLMQLCRARRDLRWISSQAVTWTAPGVMRSVTR
jgi:tetratricopeptide (TPR) repeat protein